MTRGNNRWTVSWSNKYGKTRNFNSTYLRFVHYQTMGVALGGEEMGTNNVLPIKLTCIFVKVL